jgi:hypothetical protein
MKTAMQELIEYIEMNPIVFNKELLLKLKELTFKEKEQIIEAYISDRIPCSEQDAEDYYFSTYKIEKINITELNQNK